MAFYDAWTKAIADWLVSVGLVHTPMSTIFLLFISLLISGLSGLATRLLIDQEDLKKKVDKMNDHNKRKKKAQETADKKLWIKVKRDEDKIMELQKDTMIKRTLPSLITFGPIIIMFNVLRAAFQSSANLALNGTCQSPKQSCGVVAVLPFHVSRTFPLIGGWFSEFISNATYSVAGFGFFYFLSAFVLSMMLTKLFGINLTGMQNPANPMGR